MAFLKVFTYFSPSPVLVYLKKVSGADWKNIKETNIVSINENNFNNLYKVKLKKKWNL